MLADADLRCRAIDTFVMSQLRPEIALTQRVRLHHARSKGGREEVDIVIELSGGRLLAIEVNATASPRADDARHIQWLRSKAPSDSSPVQSCTPDPM